MKIYTKDIKWFVKKIMIFYNKIEKEKQEKGINDSCLYLKVLLSLLVNPNLVGPFSWWSYCNLAIQTQDWLYCRQQMYRQIIFPLHESEEKVPLSSSTIIYFYFSLTNIMHYIGIWIFNFPKYNKNHLIYVRNLSN